MASPNPPPSPPPGNPDKGTRRLFQKNMTRATWPVVKFNGDESVGCRIATNEVQFYDPGDFSKGFVNRLRVQGVAAVELSKTPQSYVAVFVPESKGMPASVQMFACGKIYKADVDKTNQSYYGESKLNYLTTDASHDGLVPLRKEGPVHDVQWSSTGKEFAVVYGCILIHPYSFEDLLSS
ncbi:hypothetical protein Leryth_026098 [Lithospermum erythrorhizon]|nr:hypothetical protein Leryth_026098 [Lithospermum erythrorhizon]